MQRTRVLLAGILAGMSGLSAVAVARTGPTARISRAAKVQLRSSADGKILVDAAGFTLYTFTHDPRNRNTCVGITECASIWPALKTTGRPAAGPGVKASLLSTLTLAGGAKQVTYAGRPLYLYAPASMPGETSYIGALEFGGAWYAVNAVGRAVR
jgi:predicted lipoprotein with Yx(FWY)xxD motif